MDLLAKQTAWERVDFNSLNFHYLINPAWSLYAGAIILAVVSELLEV